MPASHGNSETALNGSLYACQIHPSCSHPNTHTSSYLKHTTGRWLLYGSVIDWMCVTDVRLGICLVGKYLLYCSEMVHRCRLSEHLDGWAQHLLLSGLFFFFLIINSFGLLVCVSTKGTFGIWLNQVYLKTVLPKKGPSACS